MQQQLQLIYPQINIETVEDADFRLDPENDRGHIEYKLTLVDCEPIKLQKYATQLLWRIGENPEGFAVYYIGVADNGALAGLTEFEIVEAVGQFKQVVEIIKASIVKMDLILINHIKILRFRVDLRLMDDFVDFDL